MPEDDRVLGGHPVCVISYAYWQRRFAGNPSVVGKTIHLGGTPFTIIGVTSPVARKIFRPMFDGQHLKKVLTPHTHGFSISGVSALFFLFNCSISSVTKIMADTQRQSR
jgi:hypothetical protein